MNSIDKMKALMKEYFGITVPMLYYQDHEPIEYWYDSDKNSLCAKCGVEITVNLSERRRVQKRYKEYDGCYLGHYAQWFFWFFFTIGISVVAGSMALLIARYYGQ